MSAAINALDHRTITTNACVYGSTHYAGLVFFLLLSHTIRNFSRFYEKYDDRSFDIIHRTREKNSSKISRKINRQHYRTCDATFPNSKFASNPLLAPRERGLRLESVDDGKKKKRRDYTYITRIYHKY